MEGESQSQSSQNSQSIFLPSRTRPILNRRFLNNRTTTVRPFTFVRNWENNISPVAAVLQSQEELSEVYTSPEPVALQSNIPVAIPQQQEYRHLSEEEYLSEEELNEQGTQQKIYDQDESGSDAEQGHYSEDGRPTSGEESTEEYIEQGSDNIVSRKSSFRARADPDNEQMMSGLESGPTHQKHTSLHTSFAKTVTPKHSSSTTGSNSGPVYQRSTKDKNSTLPKSVGNETTSSSTAERSGPRIRYTPRRPPSIVSTPMSFKGGRTQTERIQTPLNRSMDLSILDGTAVMDARTPRVPEKQPVQKPKKRTTQSLEETNRAKSVRLWSGGRKRNISDATDLDVALEAIEDIAALVRDNATTKAVRRGISQFVFDLREVVFDTIDLALEVRSLKSAQLKSTSGIRKHRMEILRYQKDQSVSRSELSALKWEHEEERKKLQAAKEVSSFLTDLQELQQKYRDTNPAQAEEEDYQVEANVPALLIEKTKDLETVSQLQRINSKMETWLKLNSAEMVTSKS
ncbi:centromere protein U isoform X1 [Lingula anatina]|uniref:Centromere protein U n=1 Tax=Lingula anatina TaxID=7574 RepID=A0A1S3JN72_LINAN|nr:centromere protein U isoform X1 [Lingula anatina]|eukprot:XP_013411404.1 centromere protein U isoform X1 [Lingula anatina]